MEEIEKTVLKMIGSKARQNEYYLFKMKACWSDIVGKNNAKHCGPVRLERRILTLQTDSSVWSNQFLYYKSQFIEQINSFLQTEYVKDIKFALGKGFKNSSFKKQSVEAEKKLLMPDLTTAEKKALALRFIHIKNEKIRNSIISVEAKRIGLEKLCNKGIIKKCPVCGNYLKNKEISCYFCEREKAEEQERKIKEYIKKEPWIQWYDLNKIIPCKEVEFNIVKNDIKSYYFEKVRLKEADKAEEKIAVQLKAGKPYALISEREFDNILKFLQKGK